MVASRLTTFAKSEVAVLRTLPRSEVVVGEAVEEVTPEEEATPELEEAVLEDAVLAVA